MFTSTTVINHQAGINEKDKYLELLVHKLYNSIPAAHNWQERCLLLTGMTSQEI
jgi:hypothetical protein